MRGESARKKMDRKLKAKWVRALRSGRYRQARGILLDSGGTMCCLGVLATIQGCNLLNLSEDSRCTTTLPIGFNAGLRPNQRKCLGNMNDGNLFDKEPTEPKSFKEIADYIEKNL